MILISYDIQSDKLRYNFAHYLQKYGHRVQYSVYEIENSQRILSNIMLDIVNIYEKKFGQEDSVIIIETGASSKITKFGNAKNSDSDFAIVWRVLKIKEEIKICEN